MDSSWLPRTWKGVSIFAVITGSLDICLGTSMLGNASDFPIGSPTAAITDSQIRFLGSTWAGYGVMLWWASNDLRKRQVPLGILSGIVVVGGIGRVLSAWKYGFGAPWIQVAMWVELLVPSALYLLGR